MSLGLHLGVFLGGNAVASGPAARLAVRSDAPATITSAGGVVSAWGPLTTATGSPLVVTDSVTGKQVVRFSAGVKLSTAAGAADFMSQQSTTVILVARSRNYDPHVTRAIVDSSAGGTTPGYQISMRDNVGAPTLNRELVARVSDGASFVVDKVTSGTIWNAFASLKTFVMTATVTPTRAAVNVDDASSYDDVIAVSLPAGAASPLSVGDGDVDVLVLEVYSPELTDVQASKRRAQLAAEFSIDQVQTLAADGIRYFGFACLAVCGNGDLLVAYRNGLGHAGDRGWIETRRYDGISWSAATVVQIDAVFDSRDPCLTTRPLANGDLLLTWFEPTGGGHVRLRMRRSVDDGRTWGPASTVTAGFDLVEQSSGPVIEVSAGHLVWPIFAQNLADAHSSSYVITSADNGATWPGLHLVLDGVADANDYTETNVVKATGLEGGNVYLASVRSDTDGVVYETLSPDLVTWSAKAAAITGDAHSARLLQMASGKIVMTGRPNGFSGAATILTRNGPGDWKVPPAAPGVDATQSPTSYGTMVERDPGVISFAYGIQYTLFGPADVRFRRWPEWQLDGAMPSVVSPAAPTVPSLSTQQFTATGAGDFTWSLPTNNSGGTIDAATGLYTAGVAGIGNDHVRAVDLNGTRGADAVVTVGAIVTESPDVTYGANLKQWFVSTVGTAGSWTDNSGNGNTAVSGGTDPTIAAGIIAGKPVYRFTGGAFLDHALALAYPSTVFVVMAARAGGFGEAYSAGAGIPAIEASINVGGEWGVYGAGARGSTVSILNAFHTCVMVTRGDSDCDLITNGVVHNVNPGSPFFLTGKRVGKDSGLADPVDFDVAEIVAVNREATGPEIAKTLRYLRAKYGAI